MLTVPFDYVLSAVTCCPTETAASTFASLSPGRHAEEDDFISSGLSDVRVQALGLRTCFSTVGPIQSTYAGK